MVDLTDDRREALVELINIGFGQAVGALSEILSGRLRINVPEVTIVGPQEVEELLAAQIHEKDEVSLVQQVFRGDFSGEAVLALPGRSGDGLLALLAGGGDSLPEMEADKLRQEVVLEVGNIVIGTCMGQFSDLLNTSIAYSPPAVSIFELTSERFREHLTTKEQDALLIHNTFSQDEQQVHGYLFFFLTQECLDWLFRELDRFLESLG